jgi:hypothetical protein
MNVANLIRSDLSALPRHAAKNYIASSEASRGKSWIKPWTLSTAFFASRWCFKNCIERFAQPGCERIDASFSRPVYGGIPVVTVHPPPNALYKLIKFKVT